MWLEFRCIRTFMGLDFVTGVDVQAPLRERYQCKEDAVQRLKDLLCTRMTRKQFSGAVALGLTSLVGIAGLFKKATDANPALAKGQQTSTPNYGAWRPSSASGATSLTDRTSSQII